MWIWNFFSMVILTIIFFFLVFRANLKVANRSIQINLWPAEGYAIFVCKDRYGAAGVAIEDKCIGILRYQPQPQPLPQPTHWLRFFLIWGSFFFLSFFFFARQVVLFFGWAPHPFFIKPEKCWLFSLKKKEFLINWVKGFHVDTL